MSADGERALMEEAIRLAREGMRSNAGGPFGALVAREGKIIARGWNEVTTANDPTAHAEVMAIRRACTALKTFHLEGCDLYTSCEPCPMCLASAYWARLRRVFYACDRKDAEAAGFDDAAIYSQLALPLPERSLEMRQLAREEAMALMAEWRAKPDRIKY